jgi:hypothetical protein
MTAPRLRQPLPPLGNPSANPTKPHRRTLQGIAEYAWQTVGNVVGLISAFVAAGLYGNSWVKVLYNNVFVDFFGANLLNIENREDNWV